VSDLTVEQDGLLPEILTQPAAWAGCVAGALAEDDFLHKLQLARFTGAQVLHRQPLSIDDCALYPRFSDDLIAPCANSFRLNGRAGWQWPLR